MDNYDSDSLGSDAFNEPEYTEDAVKCNYCNRAWLQWVKIKGKYKLYDHSRNEIHACFSHIDTEAYTCLVLAYHELNSIRARDGAPSGVCEKYFSDLVDRIDAIVKKTTGIGAFNHPLKRINQ